MRIRAIATQGYQKGRGLKYLYIINMYMVYTYNPAIDPFLLGGLTFQLYGLNLPKYGASHLASIGTFT